jgi:putative sigma-54 modulation protein
MQNNHPEKILMQGIHVELTPGLQSAIREKFATLLHHDNRIIRINVRLHRDQQLGQTHHFTATAQVELSGPDLVASAEDRDAYVALDQLSQRLDQLLERRHDRRKDRRNHPHPVELETPLPKADSTRAL